MRSPLRSPHRPTTRHDRLASIFAAVLAVSVPQGLSATQPFELDDNCKRLYKIGSVTHRFERAQKLAALDSLASDPATPSPTAVQRSSAYQNWFRGAKDVELSRHLTVISGNHRVEVSCAREEPAYLTASKREGKLQVNLGRDARSADRLDTDPLVALVYALLKLGPLQNGTLTRGTPIALVDESYAYDSSARTAFYFSNAEIEQRGAGAAARRAAFSEALAQRAFAYRRLMVRGVVERKALGDETAVEGGTMPRSLRDEAASDRPAELWFVRDVDRSGGADAVFSNGYAASIAVMGNNHRSASEPFFASDAFFDQRRRAAAASGEKVWGFPSRIYRDEVINRDMRKRLEEVAGDCRSQERDLTVLRGTPGWMGLAGGPNFKSTLQIIDDHNRAQGTAHSVLSVRAYCTEATGRTWNMRFDIAPGP